MFACFLCFLCFFLFFFYGPFGVPELKCTYLLTSYLLRPLDSLCVTLGIYLQLIWAINNYAYVRVYDNGKECMEPGQHGQRRQVLLIMQRQQRCLYGLSTTQARQLAYARTMNKDISPNLLGHRMNAP